MKQILHTSRQGVWSHPDTRLIVPGRALSALGDAVTLVVLSLRVADAHQPMRMTVLLIAFALPLFALAPIAGRIVDEFDSRRVLVLAGLVQVAASTGLVLATGFSSIVVWVLVLQAGQAVTMPAWSALLPRVVGEAEVGRILGLSQSLVALAGLVGSAIGGLMYAFAGYRTALLIDTASFALLVVVGAAVRTRRGRRYDATTVGSAAEEAASPGATGGMAYLRREPVLRILFPVLCLIVVSFEVTNVVEVFLIRDELGASAQVYGLATAAVMAGAIIGPVLAGRVDDDRSRVAHTALGCSAGGAAFVGVGLSPTIWPVLGLLFLAGLSVGAMNTLLGTLILTRTPEQLRGRVMATLNGTMRGFTVLAMVLGGLCGQLLGGRVTFALAGLLSMALASLVLRARSRVAHHHGPLARAATTDADRV